MERRDDDSAEMMNEGKMKFYSQKFDDQLNLMTTTTTTLRPPSSSPIDIPPRRRPNFEEIIYEKLPLASLSPTNDEEDGEGSKPLTFRSSGRCGRLLDTSAERWDRWDAPLLSQFRRPRHLTCGGRHRS